MQTVSIKSVDRKQKYIKINRIVGRINLIVFGSDKKTAELGYKIGENYTNLGYANEAVKIVLEKAFNIYGLNRIIAGTATDNFASNKVLIKNGFIFSKIIENDLRISKKWVHTEVFEITNLQHSNFKIKFKKSRFY